jgi:hypothetical protein
MTSSRIYSHGGTEDTEGKKEEERKEKKKE